MKRLTIVLLCLSLVGVLSACRPAPPTDESSALISAPTYPQADEVDSSDLPTTSPTSSSPSKNTGRAEDEVVIEDSNIGTIAVDFGETTTSTVPTNGSGQHTDATGNQVTTSTNSLYIEKYY